MNARTQVTVEEVQGAIRSAVRAAFPSMKCTDFYYDDRARLPVPACLLELTEMEPVPENDPGTGQLAVTARFSAYLLIGFRTERAHLSICTLAAAFALLAHRNRWGLPVEPATVTAICPDHFNPEFDQYLVWRVDWQQIIHLAPSVWDDDEPVPRVALGSWSPEIGPAHEPSYTTTEKDSV